MEGFQSVGIMSQTVEGFEFYDGNSACFQEIQRDMIGSGESL